MTTFMQAIICIIVSNIMQPIDVLPSTEVNIYTFGDYVYTLQRIVQLCALPGFYTQYSCSYTSQIQWWSAGERTEPVRI